MQSGDCIAGIDCYLHLGLGAYGALALKKP